MSPLKDKYATFRSFYIYKKLVNGYLIKPLFMSKLLLVKLGRRKFDKQEQVYID